jgi:hypothetical protein
MLSGPSYFFDSQIKSPERTNQTSVCVSLADFLSCKLSWKVCPFAAWKHAGCLCIPFHCIGVPGSSCYPLLCLSDRLDGIQWGRIMLRYAWPEDRNTPEVVLTWDGAMCRCILLLVPLGGQFTKEQPCPWLLAARTLSALCFCPLCSLARHPLAAASFWSQNQGGRSRGGKRHNQLFDHGLSDSGMVGWSNKTKCF